MRVWWIVLGWGVGLLGGGGELHGVEGGPEGLVPVEGIEVERLEAEREADLGRPLGWAERLGLRARAHPFLPVSTAIFLLAVVHTFLAHRLERGAEAREKRLGHRDFVASLGQFLGRIEVVFGLWLVPLLLAFLWLLPGGWTAAADYAASRDFGEPLFVVVIMATTASRPVLYFAEVCLERVARLGGATPGAWWLTLLTVAPLLGSLVTEPAAMTVAALLLGQQFYAWEPSLRLRYATLGLLFVNVSVGGTLTHFAAPPILMVAEEWQWNLPYLFGNFGWRSLVGIVLCSGITFLLFRGEFRELRRRAGGAEEGPAERETPPPRWLIVLHLAFVVWTVVTLHQPLFFVGGFLLFLAVSHATEAHQDQPRLQQAALVGFFLAALVLHGGLQGWWISPLLGALGEIPLFFTAVALTAFNDNAVITYLAAQVPSFDPESFVAGQWISKTGLALDRARALEQAVVAGAVTGGGLTLIANAPNPAGHSLLRPWFPRAISPWRLLAAALPPTAVMGFLLMVG